MRRQSVVWLAAGVLAVAAATGAVAAAWPLRAEPPAKRISIDAVYADGSALRVHLTFSSCDQVDRIDVVEEARAVRLSAYVRDRPSPTCGTAPIDQLTVDVRLNDALDDRSVVDDATGGNVLVR
ncbi:hypothetical protein [Dactylosporangium siamense]|uniref:Uncharacterized protein n=1 Tax=Dactylosporangium siamense TaxID=685454 RepID=A0A919UE50_9ACTN|nr:hypothetical protein [Dactylosporangium siamense]GIG48671.1 hypothetical protein Dsi01nite_067120 [Dactylosporangium siamense]